MANKNYENVFRLAQAHSPFLIRHFTFSRALSLGCAIVGLAASGCSGKRDAVQLAYFPPPPAQAHAVHLLSFNSLDALVPTRSSFVEILRGDQPRPFAQSPTGIVYRDGKLYVCDGGTSVVHVWDLNTGRARRLGLGDEKLAEPVAVAVADDGMVYVADSQRGEVVQFDAAGNFVRRVRAEGREVYRPIALAVVGDTLYVADSAAGTIDVFASSSGSFQSSMPLKLSEEEVKPLVAGMSADKEGRLLIADAMGGRVLLAGGDGAVARTISQRGDRYGDLGQPKHVAVGPDGVIFVADADFAHVHLFNPEGRLLMLLGGPDREVGGTPMPLGVAATDDLPESLRSLIPADFDAHYLLFVTNSVGDRRIGLFAIGLGRV